MSSSGLGVPATTDVFDFGFVAGFLDAAFFGAAFFDAVVLDAATLVFAVAVFFEGVVFFVTMGDEDARTRRVGQAREWGWRAPPSSSPKSRCSSRPYAGVVITAFPEVRSGLVTAILLSGSRR